MRIMETFAMSFIHLVIMPTLVTSGNQKRLHPQPLLSLSF